MAEHVRYWCVVNAISCLSRRFIYSYSRYRNHQRNTCKEGGGRVSAQHWFLFFYCLTVDETACLNLLRLVWKTLNHPKKKKKSEPSKKKSAFHCKQTKQLMVQLDLVLWKEPWLTAPFTIAFLGQTFCPNYKKMSKGQFQTTLMWKKQPCWTDWLTTVWMIRSHQKKFRYLNEKAPLLGVDKWKEDELCPRLYSVGLCRWWVSHFSTDPSDVQSDVELGCLELDFHHEQLRLYPLYAKYVHIFGHIDDYRLQNGAWL